MLHMRADSREKKAKAIVKAMEKKIEKAEALKPLDKSFLDARHVEQLIEEIKVPPLKALKDKKK